MSGVRTGRICKPTSKWIRVRSRSVIKMMAVIQDMSKTEVPKEFLETGRTGRRNAMPDILHPQGVDTTTADLPERLERLVTTDNPVTSSNPTEGATDMESDKKLHNNDNS